MDKRSYATVEKYAAPFVQIVLEKNQQRDVFRELSQIKGIFEETIQRRISGGKYGELHHFVQRKSTEFRQRVVSLRSEKKSGKI